MWWSNHSFVTTHTKDQGNFCIEKIGNVVLDNVTHCNISRTRMKRIERKTRKGNTRLSISISHFHSGQRNALFLFTKVPQSNKGQEGHQGDSFPHVVLTPHNQVSWNLPTLSCEKNAKCHNKQFLYLRTKHISWRMEGLKRNITCMTCCLSPYLMARQQVEKPLIHLGLNKWS